MINVHLDGSFHLSQPAFRVMKSQGYGRFVFIASSAGLFGQPQAAHYAAAKAGIVGLTNVIAIEGAAHGILANSVLPFGFSRMVTETIGGEQVAAELPFLRAIEPELVVPIVVFLASRACEFTPSQLLGRRGSLRPRLHRARRRVGSPSPAASRRPMTSPPISPRCRRPSPSASRRRSSTRWRESARGWGSRVEDRAKRTRCR